MLNPDCIRDTLLSIENDSWGDEWVFYKNSALLQKYSEKEVVHHLKLCRMTEMLGEVHPIFGRYFRVQGLSENGKAFLDSIRDEEKWQWLMERYNELPPPLNSK